MKELSKEQLYKWYDSVAEGSVFYDQTGRLRFDYEVADAIRDYVVFCLEIVIKSPYMIFKGVVISPEVLAKFLYVDEDKLVEIENSSYILDCRDVCGNRDGADPKSQRKEFSEKFLGFIYNYGDMKNDNDISVFDELSVQAEELIGLDSDIVLELEDGVIAIAIDEYVSDAKICISEALGLSEKCFIEVSSPWNTVLLIDCRYIYLCKKYYGAEDSAWLS